MIKNFMQFFKNFNIYLISFKLKNFKIFINIKITLPHKANTYKIN